MCSRPRALSALPTPLYSHGPRVSAIESASSSRSFRPFLERRDLVFVDQRGTGARSARLPESTADPQSALREFFPPESVRRCRAALEAKADLTLYTTPVAADDLDEVRAALGYERINLFGASYGTRAALVYLKRHPRSVRSVLLQGVAPTHRFMPLDFPVSAQRALDGLLGECERDEACRAAFPRVRAEAREVFEKLKKAPVDVEIKLPQTGATARVKLSRNLAPGPVRYMLETRASPRASPLHPPRGDW